MRAPARDMITWAHCVGKLYCRHRITIWHFYAAADADTPLLKQEWPKHFETQTVWIRIYIYMLVSVMPQLLCSFELNWSCSLIAPCRQSPHRSRPNRKRRRKSICQHFFVVVDLLSVFSSSLALCLEIDLVYEHEYNTHSKYMSGTAERIVPSVVAKLDTH